MSKMSESEIAQLILLEASRRGIKLWRNNNGGFHDGTRQIYFGLGNDGSKASKKMKSSDYIGFQEVTITPEMVGMKLAVFFALETKEEGWTFKGTDREEGQKNFIDYVLSRGGKGGFANSVDSFLKLIGL